MRRMSVLNLRAVEISGVAACPAPLLRSDYRKKTAFILLLFLFQFTVHFCFGQSPAPNPLDTTAAAYEIPNVFTPNEDGINDQFSISAVNITALNCTIYDRWGVKMAELKRIQEPWDGRTTSGIPAEQGVYFYHFSATGKDGKEYSEHGFIQLVR